MSEQADKARRVAAARARAARAKPEPADLASRSDDELRALELPLRIAARAAIGTPREAAARAAHERVSEVRGARFARRVIAREGGEEPRHGER